jgi:glutathione peroxidase
MQKTSFLVGQLTKRRILSSSIISGGTAMAYSFSNKVNATSKTVYDFSALDIDKNKVDLKKYEGKVLLIVNVASAWGLTNKNYTQLQEIYTKYQSQGLEILGFPCNQFGSQEPGTNEEIKKFATEKYHVTFPMFDKIEVNGDGAHPLYNFLKSTVAFKFLISIERINWNFTKVLSFKI